MSGITRFIPETHTKKTHILKGFSTFLLKIQNTKTCFFFPNTKESYISLKCIIRNVNRETYSLHLYNKKKNYKKGIIY